MSIQYRTYYNELKSRNNIIEVATSMGFTGTSSGRLWQGECPRHGSSSGKCFTIWSGTQSFKCFHCNESGDVINLVQLFKNCNLTSAVNYLAERCGMPPLAGGPEISEEEKTRQKADAKEEALVHDMLTAAVEWYHQQLKYHRDIVDHLEQHYGFSQEIIEELKIGIAPPGTSSPKITSDLAEHLNAVKEFNGKLPLTGLFTFKSPKGPLWDYFKGRIIFPYWKNGKVVNITARSTYMTPINAYECYTTNDGDVKEDEHGQPDYIKYKKLRRHDPGHEKNKHISKFIGMETFMGSDHIRGAKEVVITEGAPDWVSAVDHGFAALSPVTTNFRESDLERLAKETAGSEAIYIINDNDENKAGQKGALKTGKYLMQQGRTVFLVELPRPEGQDKIDLNEYLRDYTKEELLKLMQDAKSVLDISIENIPANLMKALPVLKEETLPILLGVEDSIREHYLEDIRKKVGTTKAVLKKEFENVKKAIIAEQTKVVKKPVDPAIEAEADKIANDPILIRKRIDLVNQSGVVGERNVIAMYCAAVDSRLLSKDIAGNNVLALKSSGHYGAGKSFALEKCLDLYPEDVFHLITNGSPKSLYNMKEGLKHKAFIIAEAVPIDAKNGGDNEFIYAVRSLLSEGRLSYQVSQKDDDGKYITVEKRLDGPTSFITTTINDKLEPQLDDRLLTIHPDESIEQTFAIMRRTAIISEGSFEGVDKKVLDAWKHFHSQMKPVVVVIPFASKISDYLKQREKLPIATRRAFGRVLSIIKTVVSAYQFQRSRDEENQLIAEMSDYWMALQIVREAFRETLGQQSKEATQRITFIEENGPVQYGELTAEWGMSKPSLTGWVKGKLLDGILSWCDEDGEEFVDNAALRKAKHSGKAYLKINDAFQAEDVTGLPTPFELTGDPRWDEGGDFYLLYDLELDRRQNDDNGDSTIVEDPEDSENHEDDSEVEEREPKKEFSYLDFGFGPKL